MELHDTISLMESGDFKDRFIAEYSQTKIRRDKLCSMLKRHEAKTLDFTPKCPIELLQKQVNVMGDYLDILIQRAKIEGIDLPRF